MDVLLGLQDFLNHAAQNQVTQFGITFTLAALLHAGQVRKEIAMQMKNVAESINTVGKALRDDLLAQNARLTKVELELNAFKNKG